jgi:hypothetical protein
MSATSQVALSLNDIQNLWRHSTSPESLRPALHLKLEKLDLPSETFRAVGSCPDDQPTITISGPDARAIAHGLYAVTQDILGFRFPHPRQTLSPNLSRADFREFTLEGSPRFQSRGFHLHTQHPIELTEPLLDPTVDQAFEQVAEYIDWLARNGQNTLQFYVLRDIDRPKWIIHARRILAYAHSRGVKVGLAIGVVSLQQRAFQLVKFLRSNYEKQLEKNLAYLFSAPWDFIALDYDVAEHVMGFDKKITELTLKTVEIVSKRYGAKTFFKTHVVPKIKNERQLVRPRAGINSGIQIHTVMFWGLEEERAPVYGLQNQRHMLEWMKEEVPRQETWYWPESSYWVTFDNSIPILLLPYLSARLADMKLIEKIGTHGHITFSSGLEWGYWLIDWSIARWSWNLTINGLPVERTPLDQLALLGATEAETKRISAALKLQEKDLKERELIRYLAPLPPFAEMKIFNEEFQPVPSFNYEWIFKKSDELFLTWLEAEVTRELEAHGKAILNLSQGQSSHPLLEEIFRSLEIGGLRAFHRAATIKALIADRRAQLARRPLNRTRDDVGFDTRLRTSPSPEGKKWLELARTIRLQAIGLVRETEQEYRYDFKHLAGEFRGHTCYDFGYLMPVHELFFWEREEEQVKRKEFNSGFMRIWNFQRCAGLDWSLFRDRPISGH